MLEIHKTRKVFTIFLGSPGDLEEERKITRNIIDEINLNYSASINWNIELLGWEDTLPSYKRPQEQINRDLIKCDLFIGLLYKRWGTPTGNFSSGFEEEFELSKKRRNINGTHPEIWLFFKDIPAEFLKDPGEQLKMVLDFKNKIEIERNLFYRSFQSTDSWESCIRILLMRYLLEKNSFEQEVNVSSHSNKPRKYSKAKTQPSSAKGKGLKASQEISGVLTTFKSHLNGKNGLGIPNTKIARLYLFAQSHYSLQDPTEIINHHVVNILFLTRNKITFTNEESITLFRAILRDRNSLMPGWYWYKSLSFNLLFGLIISEALNPNNEESRKASWGFLYEYKIKPPSDFKLSSKDLKVLNEEINQDIKEAGIKYINWVTGHSDSIITPDLFVSFKDLFDISRIELDKNRAANFLNIIEGGNSISYSTHPFLYKFSSEIPTEDLKHSIKSVSLDVKLFSAKELEKRNALDLETGAELLKEQNLTLVCIGIKTLIKNGANLLPSTIRDIIQSAKKEGETNALSDLLHGNETEEIITFLFNTYSFEHLKEQLDLFSIESSIAYNVISNKYFDIFQNTLRFDLENEFQSFLNFSIEKLRSKFGDEAEQIIENYNKSDLVNYLIQKHIAAGLSALVDKGSNSDIKFARQYSESMTYHTRDIIFQLIDKYSNEQDIPFLESQYNILKYSEKLLVAKLLLKQCHNFEEWPKRLLESGDITLFNLALKFSVNKNFTELLIYLKRFLYDEGDVFRESALAYYVLKLNESQLLNLLNEYNKKERYFYNVVVWLDRILYSPASFKESFKSILTQKIL